MATKTELKVKVDNVNENIECLNKLVNTIIEENIEYNTNIGGNDIYNKIVNGDTLYNINVVGNTINNIKFDGNVINNKKTTGMLQNTFINEKSVDEKFYNNSRTYHSITLGDDKTTWERDGNYNITENNKKDKTSLSTTLGKSILTEVASIKNEKHVIDNGDYNFIYNDCEKIITVANDYNNILIIKNSRYEMRPLKVITEEGIIEIFAYVKII
jgi:hypothetical protein